MMNLVNLRKLKNELLSCLPKERANRTFDRTDILNARHQQSCSPQSRNQSINRTLQRTDILNSQEQNVPSPKIRIHPTNQRSQIFNENAQTLSQAKIRASKSIQSQILQNTKENDQSIERKMGIKTFKKKEESPAKTLPQKPKVVKDHSTEWFYHKDDKQIQTSLKGTMKKDLSHLEKQLTSVEVLKNKNFYQSEVFESIKTVPVKKQDPLKQEPLKQEPPKQEPIKQQTPLEKKISSNQSQIFEDKKQSLTMNQSFKRNDEQYSGTMKWRDARYGQSLSEVNEKVKFDQNYAKTRKLQDIGQSPISPFHCDFQTGHKSKLIEESNRLKQVDQIKRSNRNYSDVFGVEYGSKNSQNRSVNRDISVSFEWHQVDSVKCKKDIGKIQKDDEKLQRQGKSRVFEQKSILDTHSFYDQHKVDQKQPKFSKTEQIFMEQKRKPRY